MVKFHIHYDIELEFKMCIKMTKKFMWDVFYILSATCFKIFIAFPNDF